MGDHEGARALRPPSIVQGYAYQDTGVALCTGPVLTPLIGRAGVGLQITEALGAVVNAAALTSCPAAQQEAPEAALFSTRKATLHVYHLDTPRPQLLRGVFGGCERPLQDAQL